MGSGSGPDPIFILGAFCRWAWGGGFVGRSCGFERRFAGGVWGLAGLVSASGASGAGSFAYESVCRRAGAVGAGCVGESGCALTSACATRTAVGVWRRGGDVLWRRLAPRVPRWVVSERRGCAGDLVCRRSPINSFLKFNLYLIFSGRTFEQKLDIIFLKFYNGSERREPEVEGGR